MTASRPFAKLLRWALFFLVACVSGAACTPADAAGSSDPSAVREDPDALLEAGDSALRRRAATEAFELFRKADEARPSAVGVDRWKAVGDALAADDDFIDGDKAAMSAYARALRANPAAAGLRWRQARLLVRAPVPRTERALSLLDEEERLHPGQRDAYNLRKGIEDAAAAERRRAADAAQNATAAQVARARDRQERERHEAAEAEQKERLRTQAGAIGTVVCRLEWVSGVWPRVRQ